MPEKDSQIKEFITPPILWEAPLQAAKEHLSPQDGSIIDQYRAIHSFLFGMGDTKSNYLGVGGEILGRRPDDETHVRYNKWDWVAFGERPTGQDLRDFFDLRWRALLRTEKYLRNKNNGKPTEEQTRIRTEIDRSKLAASAFSREKNQQYLDKDDLRFTAVIAILKDETSAPILNANHLHETMKFDPMSQLAWLVPRLSEYWGKKLRDEFAVLDLLRPAARTILTTCQILLPPPEWPHTRTRLTSDVIDQEEELYSIDHIERDMGKQLNRQNWTKQFLAKQK